MMQSHIYFMWFLLTGISVYFGWTKITKGFQFMNKRKHNGSTLYENELFQFIFIKFYFENIHNWGAYPLAKNLSSSACHWGGIQVTLWIYFWDYFPLVNFIKFQFEFQEIVQFHTFVPWCTQSQAAQFDVELHLNIVSLQFCEIFAKYFQCSDKRFAFQTYFQ